MTYRNLGFTPVPRDVKSILPKIYLLSSLLSDCSQTRISIKISVIFIDGEKNSSNYKLPSSASTSTVLEAEIVLFLISPATHPPVKVYLDNSTQLNSTQHFTITLKT